MEACSRGFIKYDLALRFLKTIEANLPAAEI